jgi:hypothetical protein
MNENLHSRNFVSCFFVSCFVSEVTKRKRMPEMEKMKYVATKIDSETLSEVERITRETGLKTADLLRIGLRKLIKEYAEVGKIEVGKEADGQNSQRRQAAGTRRRPSRASLRV